MNKIETVIRELIQTNIIPREGLFDITEKQLVEYDKAYNRLGQLTNGKFSPRHSRKLAGLNLLKTKFERGGTYTSCKEGLLYCIRNPSWSEFVKIGMTIDLNKRLGSYQICDPLNRFYVDRYEFVLNRREAEAEMLCKYGVNIENGEWVKSVQSEQILHSLREMYPLMDRQVKVNPNTGRLFTGSVV